MSALSITGSDVSSSFSFDEIPYPIYFKDLINKVQPKTYSTKDFFWR